MGSQRIPAVAAGLWVAGLVATSIAAADAPSAVTQVAREHTLIVGRVSDDPRKHYTGMHALGHYLADNLRELGIADSRIVLARDNAEMIRLLRAGEVDIVSETAFSALSFEAEAGAEIFLREWKKDVASYHTVFLTRKDSPIMALGDLRGRTIAFEDPGSTSGYFVPISTLRQVGLRPMAATEAATQSAPDAVRYQFASGEINQLALVALGRADAAAVSNLDWEDRERAPEEIRKQLRVFHRTPPIVRSLLLLRAGLDPALKARLKDILTAMHKNPDGVEALDSFGVKMFDDMAGTAVEDLEHARRLLSAGS